MTRPLISFERLKLKVIVMFRSLFCNFAPSARLPAKVRDLDAFGSNQSGAAVDGFRGIFRWVVPALCLMVGSAVSGSPVLTEFMASNDSTLEDDDGEYSDWIEVYNNSDASISLAGWYLTDSESNKTKWQFPAVTLGANEYLVVFASDEDRVDPGARLHTNFKLSAGGEYLALIRPDGITAETEFSPEYPAQSGDVSYGITQPTDPLEAPVLGYFPVATPGAANGGADNLRVSNEVSFSRLSGPFFEDATLLLSGAEDNQVIRYKVVSASEAGADFSNPTVEDSLYSEPIALTESVVVRAAVFSSNGNTHGPMVTHHFMHVDTESVERIDTFSSQLPVVVFDNHGFGPMVKDNIERLAWMYTFMPGSNGLTMLSDTPALAGGLELEVRGQTSSLFPKKSYKWDFLDSLGDKVELEIPGLGKFNEWAIIGPWNFDRSNIRNAFVYGLSNAMGMWAANTQFVEVFLNADGDALGMDDYAGVYVLMDPLEVEPGRLDLTELEESDVEGEAITGAYVLEIDEPDSDKYSWETENGYPGVFTSVLLIDSPKIDDLVPEQIDYIKTYVQHMENAVLGGHDQNWVNRSYLQYLDRESWVEYHLINTFVKNTDTFWRSFKLYKDRNKRLASGPVWDFDRSIDSADPRDNNPETWDALAGTSQGFSVRYWQIGWWAFLAKDPEMMQAWFDRYQQLREGPFSTGQLVDRVENLANQIGPEAAARDVVRWPDNQSEHGLFADEIDNMKDWLLRRGSWIDGMAAGTPEVTTNPDGSTTVTPASGTELIYTQEGGDPRMTAGGFAPDALRSFEAVTFPEGSNFRARGYHASLDVWPGTKWSRAIPGDIGTPFKPGPRLVNLSSRAYVGTGANLVVSGLVISDCDNKNVLLRGVGPSLGAFGVSGVLAQPILTVLNADGEVIAQNSGWDSGDDAEAIAAKADRLGAFPLTENSGDAALLLNLPAGVYSVHLSSGGTEGGVALMEAYEVDDIGSLLNISVRGTVEGSSMPMVAGFVVTGDQPKRVLVRGVGPTLSKYGVETPLADPIVQIASSGEVVMENDDWHESDADLIVKSNGMVGAFALDEGSQGAAILVTLQPGVYTASVTGADGGSGTVLVEVYELD